jgi:hypothetical protein
MVCCTELQGKFPDFADGRLRRLTAKPPMRDNGELWSKRK